MINARATIQGKECRASGIKWNLSLCNISIASSKENTNIGKDHLKWSVMLISFKLSFME